MRSIGRTKVVLIHCGGSRLIERGRLAFLLSKSVLDSKISFTCYLSSHLLFSDNMSEVGEIFLSDYNVSKSSNGSSLSILFKRAQRALNRPQRACACPFCRRLKEKYLKSFVDKKGRQNQEAILKSVAS